MNKAIIGGAVLAGLAVILGAFGTHGLKDSLSDKELTWWNTAQYYHTIHSLGLIAGGLLAGRGMEKHLRWCRYLFLIGIIFFSGSLYIMALWPDLRWLGAITPLGGVSFIIGWISMALSQRK